jgi:2Fe-2S ferredoxin
METSGGVVADFINFAGMDVYKLKINFEEQGLESVELPIAAGESVLDVCLDNGIELQHNCGGVCGCSTCHVYVNKGMDNVREISDKEEDFIDRAVNPRISSRLGCQCVVIDGDLEVTLPDQNQFLGH